MFVLPFHGGDFDLTSVDLHNRTGTQNREHRVIGHADETIHTFAEVELLKQADRNLTPNLYKSRQQVRLVKLDLSTRAQGNYHCAAVLRFGRFNKLGFRWRKHRLIASDVAHAQTKKRKDVRPAVVINHRK